MVFLIVALDRNGSATLNSLTFADWHSPACLSFVVCWFAIYRIKKRHPKRCLFKNGALCFAIIELKIMMIIGSWKMN